jgi:hypothetical protein
MDSKIKERIRFKMLGEFNSCHVGRTVYGWRRNLWSSDLNKISGIIHLKKSYHVEK